MKLKRIRDNICVALAAVCVVSGIVMAVRDKMQLDITDPSETVSIESENTAPVYDGKAQVIRVVDGDTYLLDIDGEEKKVRLIGVDTPESVAPDSYCKDNTSEGTEVSEIVKNKISAGDMLYYEYDAQKTDKYGRTLAYLYFEDGKMVEEWLLENGYANTATYPPNVRYSERFTALAHEAAENGIGLWNGTFTD